MLHEVADLKLDEEEEEDDDAVAAAAAAAAAGDARADPTTSSTTAAAAEDNDGGDASESAQMQQQQLAKATLSPSSERRVSAMVGVSRRLTSSAVLQPTDELDPEPPNRELERPPLDAGPLSDSASISRSNSASSAPFMYKVPPLLVLRVEEDGTHALIDMQRDEVLSAGRAGVPELPPPPPPPPHAGPEGRSSGQESAAQRSARRFKGTLQPRDIRLFDPAFSNSHDPEVLVRRHAVLMNLDVVKALVLHDRCFFFVPDGADSWLGDILLRLKDLSERFGDASFEMRAYETVLLTLCSHLEEEYAVLRPAIVQTINQVLTSTSGVVLERLRQVDRDLLKLEARASATSKALSDVLQSDADMALMNLSQMQMHPHNFEDAAAGGSGSLELDGDGRPGDGRPGIGGPHGGGQRGDGDWDGDGVGVGVGVGVGDGEDWACEHEDVELLLENYLQTVDGINMGLKGLQEDIDAARSATTLRLSSAQNKLLSVELLVSTVTATGTYGALVAAVFGMNLFSDVEEEPDWFWTVFAIVVGGAPLLIVLVFCGIKRRGLLIT